MIKKIASKIGIDKAIAFTSSSTLVGTLGSVITVFLVVKYFTGVEQGFYYTFGSLIAIQIFFELGLNGIITQYVAHEASNLKLENSDKLLGDPKYLSRISSLLHFSINWYVFFSFILLISLNIVGFIFFKRYDTSNGSVNWVLPWILLSFGTSLNLFISPIFSFIQGLGKVQDVAKIQLLLVLQRFLIIWLGLILGAKLFIVGLSSLICGATSLVILLFKYHKLFINIWNTSITHRVNYYKEIFPYQWKVAISWISGYFIFQLFNPVLFATEGSVVAGQMGMTLSALTGIQALSFSWISTKIPLFSNLISQKKYLELDNIFNKTAIQSAIVNVFALISMFFIIYVVRYYNFKISGKPLASRFLNYLPMFFMMIPIFTNQLVGFWATYLRCHKKEPFLFNSIVAGILSTLSTIILGKYFGVIGITSGYCILSIIMLPWGYYIFITKKKEWHKVLQ